LSIPMPRRVFSPDELANTTLKAAGMSPRGMLIVQAGIATDMKQDTTPIIRPGAFFRFFSVSLVIGDVRFWRYTSIYYMNHFLSFSLR
jgi:hypothetical protein